MVPARLRPLLSLILLLLPATPAVLAQNDRVDDFVKAEMHARKIPGLSIAIVKNGEVIKAKGYGSANVESNVMASPETVYQSGSVGKQFTAALVMMLVEEGRMSLEDPISRYLGDSPEIWKKITVRHLLTHTSGISNKLYDQINMRQDYTEEDLVKKIAALPLDFQPGEKWNYSNPGYVMLGVLIHKATGKFYGDLLRERIFAPLGMTTARIINEADIVPNRSAGYHLVKGELKNQEWVSPSLNTTADGSLYVTVYDMAKWDAALYTEKLIQRASLQQMWMPVRLNSGKVRPYGFGWAIAQVNGRRLIEHGGAWQGFTSHISRYVDDKLTVIVLTNLAGAYPDRIAHGLAGLYDPDLAPKQRRPAEPNAGAPQGGKIVLAGARSSAYGIKPFPTPEGWGKALKTMSGYFPGSTPVGIWIVGRLHGASTGISLEFPRPPDGVDYGPLFNFAEADKHEPFLNYFDSHGIKVFLQIEPGFADVERCIDLVLAQYKKHPCVLGWGIDVEWFKNAKTGDDNAVATDDLVKVWDARVKSHNPKYRIFVKHFRTADLPRSYRGDVVFVNDSQQFDGLDGFLKEYREFADFFYPNTVLYQIGYRADKKWWGMLEPPIPKTVGEKLSAVTRQECGIVWVDFSLRDVLPTE